MKLRVTCIVAPIVLLLLRSFQVRRGPPLGRPEVGELNEGTQGMVRFRTLLLTCGSAMALATAAWAGPKDVKVEVVDKVFDVAGGMLAYTEFELSGEPLAEGLGLDLDVLNPNHVDAPTKFDYTAGIESYEYSEEAMYAVNYQSKMGPHLVNGPVNAARGGTMDSLGKRFVELMDSVGFDPAELQLNLYPLTFPYAKGLPEFGQKVDVSEVKAEEVEIPQSKGKAKTVNTVVPAYWRDFASLAWAEGGMDKTATPAAIGAEMLKDVMWAQDFLGGMHVKADDKEVKAESPTQDQDGKHALGVSAKDGVNGVILAEITWDKLRALRDSLGYDGKALGARMSPGYDARKAPIWFPNAVAVAEAEKNGVKAVGALTVKDGGSSLRNTWMLLWPLSEAYAMTDQRADNKGQNPAFLAVYDGAPFPSAPAANRNLDLADYVAGDDPFSLASGLAGGVFQNLDALHFDAKAGTLVDRWADGKAGAEVTTYDAAYALVALQIFQRSQDALPVGYASGESAEGLKTQRGARALELIKAEADFIVGKLIGKDGLAVDSYAIGSGASGGKSLGTQFAVIRGLAAAFKATGDDKYRKAARALYAAVEAKMFDKALGTYAEVPGQATTHTAWTAAAISAGLRELMETLRNQEGEKDKILSMAHLTDRYVQWFRMVVNGRSPAEGMQRSEWLGDSGELMIKGDNSGDSDRDNVPQITKAGGPFGTAPVLAGAVKVSLDKK